MLTTPASDFARVFARCWCKVLVQRPHPKTTQCMHVALKWQIDCGTNRSVLSTLAVAIDLSLVRSTLLLALLAVC